MNTRPGIRSADREKRTPARRGSAAIWDAWLPSSKTQFLLDPLGCQKQQEHQQEHAERDGCAQRPVVSRAEEADHDIRDHDSARPSDKERRQKIAQAENECERSAG